MDYDNDDGYTYIPPESELGRLIDSLIEDERKNNIINYYYRNNEYLNGFSRSMKMLDYFISHKDKAYNVVKTTRAGFTTNIILSSLIKNKKILLVAPTNKILYDTVLNSYNLYVKITGDFKKYIRPIPNNKDGCSCVLNKLKTYPQLNILPYISSEDCTTCTKYNTFKLSLPKLPTSSTPTHCILKTMFSEQDYSSEYSPDVLTITYDKFATLSKNPKSELFKNLISKVDIIVFDEIGEYLSKSYQGFEIFRESEIETFSDKHITSLLISRIPMIKNLSSKAIITHLYENYIKSFLSFLSKTYTGNFPKIIINPLTQDIIETSIPIAKDISKDMRLNKQLALSKKYREYYNVIESLLIDNEPTDLVLLLINLLNLMTKKQLLFYELNTASYNPKYTKVKSIFISSAQNEIINNLNKWSSEDKIIIFSDATMPANNLHGYKAKEVKNIFYGDPSSNNKSSLVFHDKTITPFSKYAYFNKYSYREALISRLIELLKLDYYGNEVIWCSSKDVAYSIASILNANAIPTCSHDKAEPHSVMITYYGSTFTRGVESSRRYQILIGKAIKPHNSYKHIAYMQRNNWNNLILEKDLNNLSSREGISLPEYITQIKNWSNITQLNEYIILNNNISPNLISYFEHISSSIQKEKIYMDTWQAASRVKDPTSKTRSVNICLGWTLNEVHDMLKWGSNETITYSPESSKRLIKTQKNLIPQPPVLSSEDITHIRSWLNNNPLEPHNIGFSENIIEGIRNIVINNSEVSLEDVWISLCKSNIEFNNNSDKHDNGYLIGAINSAILYNIGDDIEIIKSSDTEFTFKHNPTSKPKPKSYTIRKSEFLNILEILRAIYLIDSSTVSYRDIRHFISPKKIPTPILRELWEIIIYNNIFLNSTWSIEDNKIIKTTSESLSYEKHKSLISLRLKSYPNAHEICKYILEWYYNEKTLYEIDLNTLTEYIPRFYHNLIAIKDIVETLLNSDEWKEFNFQFDIERTLDNIIFTRSSIVY